MNLFRKPTTRVFTKGDPAPTRTFNPFAKQEAAEVATAEQIQRELVDRSDEVLAEAHALLAAPCPVSERALRLERIGFSSNKEAKDAREHQYRIDAAKRKADTARKNTEQYPGLRFIPTENMQAVCKKYSLLLTTIDRYTGEIPDWALDRIEGCGLKFMRYVIDVPKALANTPGLLPRHQHRIIGIQERGGWMMSQYDDGMVRVETDDFDLACRLHEGDVQWMYRYSLLMIAAPVKDITVHHDEEIEAGTIFQVKDPIVCFTVEDGYMVVCAWGEEGKDPRVFNADHN